MQDFTTLMKRRIRRILLICNNYDSYYDANYKRFLSFCIIIRLHVDLQSIRYALIFKVYSILIVARLWAIVNLRTRKYDCGIKGGFKAMIVFDRLWSTMKERGFSQYKLIKEYKISNGQLDRLRKNGNVNTYTLNQLCQILGCSLEDIAEYKED